MIKKTILSKASGAVRGTELRRSIAALLAGVTLLVAVPGFAGPPKAIDPAAVKVKVEKLGVGEHVMVRRTEGPTLRGHIVGIERDEFQIRPDNTSTHVSIAYGQVVKVRKNPGPFAWMLVGAIITVVIIVAAK